MASNKQKKKLINEGSVKLETAIITHDTYCKTLLSYVALWMNLMNTETFLYMIKLYPTTPEKSGRMNIQCMPGHYAEMC